MRNATKTDMVVEMKSGKIDKEYNTEEERSLRSKRVSYTINEKNSSKEENQFMQRGTITDGIGERE